MDKQNHLTPSNVTSLNNNFQIENINLDEDFLEGIKKIVITNRTVEDINQKLSFLSNGQREFFNFLISDSGKHIFHLL